MAVSELPGNPNAVWTVKRHIDGMRQDVCYISFSTNSDRLSVQRNSYCWIFLLTILHGLGL